jgi:HK97 family phage major capsid protein
MNDPIISTKLNTLHDDLKGYFAKNGKRLDDLQKQVDNMDKAMQSPGGAAIEQRSVGDLLIEADDVQTFGKRWIKGNAGVQLDRAIFPWSAKTLIDGTAVGSSTPGILIPERMPGIVKPPTRALRVRDLIPFFPTGNNAVEFIKENVFTNAASPQTEGSAKEESALTFVIDSAPVRTIAHWIPATRQIMDDLAVLRGYVDTRLLDGLLDIEDYELLRGDGTGQHVSGLTVEATAVVGTYAASGDTKIDKVCNAITELEDAEFRADGLIVHPSDWRLMTKIKTEEGGANKGMYVLGGPGSTPDQRLWDLPLVRTTAMLRGHFLVGQFIGSVMGFDRMQSTIDVSNSHDDYFVKNKVAIRAEERIALAVLRPGAFRHGTY